MSKPLLNSLKEEHNMKHFLLVLSLLVSHFNILCQKNIPVNTSVSSDSITIGQNVDFLITVDHRQLPASSSLVLDFGKIENLAYKDDTLLYEQYADVEIIDNTGLSAFLQQKKLSIPISQTKLDEGQWQKGINLGFYSIGAFHIPSPSIIGENGDTIAIPTGNILRVFPPPNFGQDSTKMINDIKPIISIPSTIQDYMIWIYILIGLLLGIVLIWWLRKLWPTKEEQVEIIEDRPVLPKTPAHITALKGLDTLKKEAIWKNGEIKKYQSDLTRIIRTYLEERFDINALEMTSSEIISKLHDEPLIKDNAQELKEILQIADMVKFAKAKPSEEVHESFLIKAYNFVHQTKLVGDDE